ncbi:unnamed protein product [Lymnaea stagnalis]|uniref:Uncharacterized protein n=1 Tax=Lymnaea stagnalis TaxID=6523 RepID=A0AAV2HKN7_LYMST
MEMELTTKKQSGKLTIHDKDVVDHVILDSQKAKSEFELQKSKQPTKMSDSVISSLPKTPSTISVTKLPLNKSANAQNWLDKETIKELQERTDQETLSAKKLYSSLLETEQTFVKKLDDLLTHKELVDLRRKELLYLKWSEQVFEPIRKKIVEAVDGSDWLHLDRRKREMHRQFLEHVNKRGYVFLEDDDREQYYGQALNDHRPAPIKITTEVLKDPLLTLSRKRAEEERTILQCSTGYKYSDKDVETVKLPPLPLIPLGRHGVDSRKWLQMPLTNIESESRMRSRNRMLGINTKSLIDFSAWAQSGFDPKLVEQELQIPRRRTFLEKPPFGKPPVEIPKTSFIDPEEFADKIINTNPFPTHMARLRAEAEERRAYFEDQLQQQQQFMGDEHFMEQPFGYFTDVQMPKSADLQLQPLVLAVQD